VIPASGEFTYATQVIRKTTGGSTGPFGISSGGTTTAENLNALPDTTDMVVALDRLQAMAPAVESVSLVVAWFGTDLHAGNCQIRPGVEVAAKATTPRVWSVNGVGRSAAHLVSRDSEDRPVYGGTPSDFAVVQAIQEMRARGPRVTFYPFNLMDVPPGNRLPNPYSDNAAQTGQQPVFPWRGRITCSPAAGFAGTVDKTATANIRQDRAAYDLPLGDPRPAALARPLVLTAPDVAYLDLPQLTEDQPAHRPFLAAHARPWPGELAVFRSPGSDGFELLITVPSRARMGVLAFDP
jgi:hypothetical protein